MIGYVLKGQERFCALCLSSAHQASMAAPTRGIAPTTISRGGPSVLLASALDCSRRVFVVEILTDVKMSSFDCIESAFETTRAALADQSVV